MHSDLGSGSLVAAGETARFAGVFLMPAAAFRYESDNLTPTGFAG